MTAARKGSRHLAHIRSLRAHADAEDAVFLPLQEHGDVRALNGAHGVDESFCRVECLRGSAVEEDACEPAVMEELRRFDCLRHADDARKRLRLNGFRDEPGFCAAL